MGHVRKAGIKVRNIRGFLEEKLMFIVERDEIRYIQSQDCNRTGFCFDIR